MPESQFRVLWGDDIFGRGEEPVAEDHLQLDGKAPQHPHEPLDLGRRRGSQSQEIVREEDHQGKDLANKVV